MWAEILGMLAGAVSGLIIGLPLAWLAFRHFTGQPVIHLSETRRWIRAHEAYAARRAAPYLTAIEHERRASQISGAPACSAEDERCT